MANFITGIRMICSIALAFCQVRSVPFKVFYILAGLSDMIDGRVAVITHTESEFGAKLDTIADCLFVAMCFYKLLPYLKLPFWICIWVAVVAAIKVVSLLWGYISHKKLIAVHSTANKVCGILLFVLPMLVEWRMFNCAAAGVCAAATFAAVHECYSVYEKCRQSEKEKIL